MKSEDIKNLNIAIIGAGYGGAAAAKALSLLGANVNVYEQASQMREVGAGIGLRPATMDRFSTWGIFDAIAKVSSPSDYFEILTATGEPIMKDTWPEFGGQAHTYLIHRGDFIEALLGVLPEGMVHLGHKLESIEERDGRSVLSFTNGNIAEADLVVGADGIKSVVREQLFSDKGPCSPESTPTVWSFPPTTPTDWWSTTTCGCTSARAPRSICCRFATGTRCPSTSLP